MRILYLDCDTLRADHLGCYGYCRNTSPNIDRLCAEGIRFDNYYCSDAPCLPSRTALMTSRFGIHTGVVGHGGTAADVRLDGEPRGFIDSIAQSSLPAFLRNQGLHTVFVGGFGERHAAWSFYAGFREILDTGKRGMESAEDVSPTALDWIERRGKEDNWYLHVNYWDPHTPYRAPEDFGNPFQDDPLPEWFNEDLLEKHRAMTGPHTAQDLAMYDNRTDPQYPRYPGELRNMEDMRSFIDGYDCGIRYMDDHIGMILKALEQQGVLEDTVIMVSADHGENMGELGIYGEHGTADQITCRIPLIIRWPGKPGGQSDKGLHYNLDLAPTLAEIFDQPPHPWWDGQSFAPAILEGAECGRDYLVISQCAHVCQRSVRWDDWLYMRTWHDGYHLFPKEMLFNIKEDPHEQHNVAGEHPELCKQGAWYLMDWHDRMMATMPHGYNTDPLWTVMAEGGPMHAKGQLKNYCERLKETGRGEAVEELQIRHPQEFS
jgi:arylsulfatase A-like enzyme